MEARFIEIITEHQQLIHKICKVYGNAKQDREDLFQDILLALWKAWPAFRQDSKITTWMYRIAFCTAIARYRRPGKSVPEKDVPLEDLTVPVSPQNFEEKERIRLLYRAIEELNSVEKALILLYLEEHSYHEMSEIMGITETNIGVKLNRTIKKLKKTLNIQYDVTK